MRALLDRFGRKDFLLPFLSIVCAALVLLGLLSTLVSHPLFRPNLVHFWSTVILMMYFWGVLVLPDLRRHLNFVVVGMLLDLLLTLYHEVGLRAVSYAIGLEKMPFDGNLGLLRFHIWVSALLLLAYALVWYSGRNLLPKQQLLLKRLPLAAPAARLSWKRAHRVFGVLVIVLNTLSWASSPYWLMQLVVAD